MPKAPSKTSRARRWCGTWFTDKFDDQVWKGWFAEDLRYFVGQLETCPTSGRMHLQFYVELTKAYRFPTLKALEPEIHWAICRGTQSQNVAYCTKVESRSSGPFEIGEKGKQGDRSDLEVIRDQIKEGDCDLVIADSNFGQWVRYHKSVTAYRTLLTPDRDWKMDCRLYWGDAGTGKSFRAHKEFPDAFVKSPCNEWWDGYEGQEAIIMDDYYGTLQWTVLLQLMDRYPMQLQVKGGQVKMQSKVLIFTSNVNYTEWYDFANKRHMKPEALRRRFTQIVHFDAMAVSSVPDS